MGVGSFCKKQFLMTPTTPSTLLSGKLIRIAANEPPTVIIIEGMSINGIKPPLPIAIDPKTRPMPSTKPMIVAMSMYVRLSRCSNYRLLLRPVKNPQRNRSISFGFA